MLYTVQTVNPLLVNFVVLNYIMKKYFDIMHTKSSSYKNPHSEQISISLIMNMIKSKNVIVTSDTMDI